MLIKRFIQNYFEVHGNFDNIELTAASDWLRNTSKAEGITIKELCFRMLGFSFSETVSAEECYTMTVLAAKGDKATLCKKLGCKTVKEIKEQLLTYNILYLNVLDKTSLTKGERECLNALYEYYRYCSRKPVVIDNDRFSLSSGLPFLRHHFKNVTEAYKVLQDQEALVCYKKCKSKTHVENNCLYTSYDIDLNKVNKLAVQFIFCGYGLSYNILLAKNDKLSMLSLSNPNVYLNLLGIAGACNITYKQLLSYVDIHIEDQTDFFNTYGMVLQVYNGLAYYTDSTCTDAKPFYTQNIEAFEMKLSAMLGGLQGEVFSS